MNSLTLRIILSPHALLLHVTSSLSLPTLPFLFTVKLRISHFIFAVRTPVFQFALQSRILRADATGKNVFTPACATAIKFVSFALNACILLVFGCEFALYKWNSVSTCTDNISANHWKKICWRAISDCYSLSSSGNHWSIISTKNNVFKWYRGTFLLRVFVGQV